MVVVVVVEVVVVVVYLSLQKNMTETKKLETGCSSSRSCSIASVNIPSCSFAMTLSTFSSQYSTALPATLFSSKVLFLRCAVIR